jgi:DNA-binding transcriptional MerR regulator
VRYQIGHFSLLTRLPVKTLRYYHEVGLLEPDHVDAQSGYRYYSSDQVELARLIRHLRQLEFSVDACKDALARISSGEPIAELVAAQRAAVRSRIAELRALEANLERLAADHPTAGVVDRVHVSPELAACSRFTGDYPEVGSHFGRLLAAAGPLVCGPAFALYRQAEYLPGGADIEACVSVARPLETDEITCRVVPGCDGIATIHEGPYDRLGDAYQVLFDYAGDHDLEVHIPIRERYLRGAGDPTADPAEYRTQIVVPVTG